MAMMAALIRLGADPLALNSTKRTPLQLLAIKVSVCVCVCVAISSKFAGYQLLGKMNVA